MGRLGVDDRTPTIEERPVTRGLEILKKSHEARRSSGAFSVPAGVLISTLSWHTDIARRAGTRHGELERGTGIREGVAGRGDGSSGAGGGTTVNGDTTAVLRCSCDSWRQNRVQSASNLLFSSSRVLAGRPRPGLTPSAAFRSVRLRRRCGKVWRSGKPASRSESPSFLASASFRGASRAQLELRGGRIAMRLRDRRPPSPLPSTRGGEASSMKSDPTEPCRVRPCRPEFGADFSAGWGRDEPGRRLHCDLGRLRGMPVKETARKQLGCYNSSQNAFKNVCIYKEFMFVIMKILEKNSWTVEVFKTQNYVMKKLLRPPH